MIERASLADVARAAGVHASTASRALNPDTRSVVSSETVTRVLEAAERLGYRPNPLARGLRTDRTFAVGMVVPDLENPLFPPLVRGAELALYSAGYSLLIGNTDNDRAHTEAVVGALSDRRVDGLILATAELGNAMEARFRSAGTPVVLVNRQSDDPTIPAIIGDDAVGIGLAVDHLAGLGHESIGHVAGPSGLSTGVGRTRAFTQHMARHGLGGENVEEAEWFGVEPGRLAAADLLKRRPDLTAIIAGNDLLALGTIRAAGEAGLSVPSDLSVLGYNDMPFVDQWHPPLTTVRVPYRLMGEMAARTLLDLVANPSAPVASRHLEPTLAIRASTASPR